MGLFNEFVVGSWSGKLSIKKVCSATLERKE
jgi:hypothetical protein